MQANSEIITAESGIFLNIIDRYRGGSDADTAQKHRRKTHSMHFPPILTKNEGKKKVRLAEEQIQAIAKVYHDWQNEGTIGYNYEFPEYYRSVSSYEIERSNWSLIPSKYIGFIDHDMEIDFDSEMSRIQKEMSDIITQEKQSQKMLENAFRGIGYGIE